MNTQSIIASKNKMYLYTIRSRKRDRRWLWLRYRSVLSIGTVDPTTRESRHLYGDAGVRLDWRKEDEA